MPSCELCGKSGSLVEAEIEEVTMSACTSCAKMGTIIRRPVFKKKQVRRQEQPDEQVRIDFAEVIRGERKKRGMTQQDFAQFLNEKQSLLMKYENGTLKPGLASARRLEKLLKIPLVEVVSSDSEFEIKKIHTSSLTIGDMIKK